MKAKVLTWNEFREMFTDVENLEKWLGVDYKDSDSPRITDEAEFN